ncbi:lanthionine synthetase LanC family protein [Paracoccus aestuariivivens]|uniref:Lanthionine synthetase C family protein n=1 Tax=Paracoccus aestuariivivens TaxID=1820333 RepID=A0A6L6JJU7_9RHOB|nr:lanthionine synthetase LanC family protein [Paracoccus aestuariivivens]MTH80131.1 hypothetical protein [Paracoccus aestuariivivens]
MAGDEINEESLEFSKACAESVLSKLEARSDKFYLPANIYGGDLGAALSLVRSTALFPEFAGQSRLLLTAILAAPKDTAARGVIDGVGAQAYAIAFASAILNEVPAAEKISDALRHQISARQAPRTSADLDLLHGLLGLCLAGFRLADAMARTPDSSLIGCAESLVEFVVLMDDRSLLAAMGCGASHGLSGVALAFFTFDRVGIHPAAAEQALRCLNLERHFWLQLEPTFDPKSDAERSWCRGTAGLTAAQIAATRTNIGISNIFSHPLEPLSPPQSPELLSLCCGLLGHCELMSRAANFIGDTSLNARSKREFELATKVFMSGKFCEISTIGLFRGLSGFLWTATTIHQGGACPSILLLE